MSIREPGGLSEYIQHHLQVHSGTIFGYPIHWDTFFVALGIGLLFVLWFGLIARKATSGVPGTGQAFVEIIIEFIDGQIKDVFHGDRSFLGPLALTIFMWVLMMNIIDVVPIDLVSGGLSLFGGPELAHSTHFKSVPTADVFTTFAMSLTIFILTIFYSIKAKGGGGFVKEIFTAPFHTDSVGGKIAMIIPNLLLNIVEYLSKPVSLAMRLFGNMFGGELVFMLIAGLFSSWITFGFGVAFGFVWGAFELLIIVLQAYIFMVLSVVYIAMAHEHH